MEDIDYKELENKSIEEIENLRIEKLKEYETEQKHCSIVEQEFLGTQRKIIELTLKKKDLEVVLSKAKSNIRGLKNQIEVLKSIFWQKRT